MYETGCDFTNSFRKLSFLSLNGENQIEKDISDYIDIILKECRPLDEMKNFFKPKFPKEYIFFIFFYLMITSKT